MSPILLLGAVLQIACAVHAIRTGRPMYWLFLLLIGSYIAVVIYVIAEVVPEMRNSAGARRILRNARDIKQVIQKVGQKMTPAQALPVSMQAPDKPLLRGKRILVVDAD